VVGLKSKPEDVLTPQKSVY